MGHIDLLGANKGTGLGGMTSIDSLIAVKEFQSFLSRLFSGVHQANNTGHERIGTQEIPMTADACLGAAEAVDTPGGFHISFQFTGRYPVLTLSSWPGRGINDVRFGLVNPFIGLVKVHNEIPNNGGDGQRLYPEGGASELLNRIFHEKLTGKQWLSVHVNRAASTLSVFAGRVPGQRWIQFIVDFAEHIGESKDPAGFQFIILKPTYFLIRIVALHLQGNPIDSRHRLALHSPLRFSAALLYLIFPLNQAKSIVMLPFCLEQAHVNGPFFKAHLAIFGHMGECMIVELVLSLREVFTKMSTS